MSNNDKLNKRLRKLKNARLDVIEQAAKWNQYVQAAYSDEIVEAIANSKIYSPEFQPGSPEKRRSRTTLMDIDTVGALFALDEADITVFNYADYKYAGGMFLEGSTAQEEALCHKSILFPVLNSFEDCYYAPNRKDSRGGLFTNRAIFSKNILFEQNSERKKTANVLTCAAPNWGNCKYNNISKSENNKVIRERLKWINKILADNNVDTFVAGAWGCGVFLQDPKTVAAMMIEEITYPKNLILAIPAGRNYSVFKEVLEAKQNEKAKH